jgi:ribosomal protein S18 acetylase RimI-like enzyme
MSSAEERAGGAAIIIRRAQPGDAIAVYALAEGEPAAASWPMTAYQRFVAAAVEGPQLRAMFVACPASPGAGADPIIGFVAATLLPGGPCEIENIAVLAGCRRTGVASRLLQILSLWCRACAAKHPAEVWLEVRSGNAAALAFYQRVGFYVTGQRAAYYSDGEDALLLSARLRP